MNDLHTEKVKRLELSLANTEDILERYDNEEYHRLTWNHLVVCSKYNIEYIYQTDSISSINEDSCTECENCVPTVKEAYVEIAESDF